MDQAKGSNNSSSSSSFLEKDLSDKVARIRSNKMSFANEGIELSVNIPDTFDVQDTFVLLNKTVVAQQDFIFKLQNQLMNVIEDNNKTKRELNASIDTLNDMQQFMTKQIAESNNAIKNLAMNIQGFDDSKGGSGPTGNMSLSSQGNVYLTDLSGKQHQVELVTGKGGRAIQWGGPLKGPGISNLMTMTKAQKVAFYREIPAFNLPKEVKNRWKWALRKIIWRNRMNRLKVGVTRTKVAKGMSVFEKISFLEDEAIAIPNRMTKLMKALLEKLDNKVTDDITKVKDQQERDKKELSKVCDGLKSSINTLGELATSLNKDLIQVTAGLKKEIETREALGKRVHTTDYYRITRRLDFFVGKTVDLFEILTNLSKTSTEMSVSYSILDTYTLGTLYKQSQELRILNLAYLQVKSITESMHQGCLEIAQELKDLDVLLKGDEKDSLKAVGDRIGNILMNVDSASGDAIGSIEKLAMYEKYIFSRMESMMNDNSAVDAIKQATQEIHELQKHGDKHGEDIERLNLKVHRVQSEIEFRITEKQAQEIAQELIDAMPNQTEKLQREINDHIEAIVRNLIETHGPKSSGQKRSTSTNGGGGGGGSMPLQVTEIKALSVDFRLLDVADESRQPEKGDRVVMVTGQYEGHEGFITGLKKEEEFADDEKDNGENKSQTDNSASIMYVITLDPEGEKDRKIAKRIEELTSGAVGNLAEKLRIEIEGLSRKIQLLSDDSVGGMAEMIENLASNKADISDLERKVDSSAVDSINMTIKDMIDQMSNMKDVQLVELKDLKRNMKSNLRASIDKALEESKKNDPSISLLTTKQICLGCGRDSVGRSLPYYTHGPHSTIDVSKLDSSTRSLYPPGHIRPHSSSRMERVERSSSKGGNNNINTDNLNQNSIDDSTIGDHRDVDFNGPAYGLEVIEDVDRAGDIIYIAGDTRRPYARPTVVGGGGIVAAATQYDLEQDDRIKPIYRGKGFTGKKSQRAETAFGSARFELSPLDMSRSLSTVMTISSSMEKYHNSK